MSKLVNRFEDLVAWQRAVDLGAVIYDLTSTGRFARDPGFSDQMRRSAISISSNIAEGFERHSRADFRRFLAFAKASCAELRSQIHVAVRLKYISTEIHDSTIAAQTLSRNLRRS